MRPEPQGDGEGAALAAAAMIRTNCGFSFGTPMIAIPPSKGKK